MSGSERRPAAGHVQLDSRPILPTTDGNENITEVDAFNISHVNTWDLLGPSVAVTVGPQPSPECAVTYPMLCFALKPIKLQNATPKHTEPHLPRVFSICDSRQSLDPSVEYKMNHPRRGVALIFNHDHFYWQLQLPDRRGTIADGNNLKRSLTDLGFEVRLFHDLKAEDVLQKIHEASKDDHSNADCFVCVFLSHGEDDHIYAYDGKIKIQTVTDMFRGNECKSLVGKPKIFIIQEDGSWEVPQEVSGPASCSKQSHGVKSGHAGLYAIFIQITVSKLIYEPGLQQIVIVGVYRACRGNKHDDAVEVIAHDSTDSCSESLVNETEVDAAGVYTLPAGADFIMCYSVAQGYYSHRETVNGSWYIQDLCETLRKHGSSLEFTELLTLVNRKVSYRRVDVCKDINAIGKKQIPCFASMLTKKLYFHPKSK